MKGRCENIFSFSFGMCEDVQRCMSTNPRSYAEQNPLRLSKIRSKV